MGRGRKTIRALWALWLLSGFCAPLSARIHLLLDERLRKSPIEQVLYRFVPLSSAAEVELTYVRDFLREENARTFAKKLRPNDRGIYIGAERYPSDAGIAALSKSRDFFGLADKIYVLVVNHAPPFAPLPRGILPHEELWRKFAELAQIQYAGFHNLHYLDGRVVALKNWRFERGDCVHESGLRITPPARGPIKFTREGFALAFRHKEQARYTGDWVCTNTPRSDIIFQVRIARTDVMLAVPTPRFSAWNDAQRLVLSLRSNRQISVPLTFEIVPEFSRGETEFFFQGDRLVCSGTRCGKKSARFLLPQLSALEHDFEFAFRGPAENYFRGTLRLLSGELEVARVAVRLLPHSWLAELKYALLYPSEYRRFFIFGFAGAIFLLLLLYFAYRMLLHLLQHHSARHRSLSLPVQSSGMLEVKIGDELLFTATHNPLGYELLGFGSIVRIAATLDGVTLRHGQGQQVEFAWQKFCYTLPDGYVFDFRPLGEKAVLYIYRLSERGWSATLPTRGQTAGLSPQ